MIKALAHACIGSTDLDKTKAFYCDLLGMTHQFDFIRNGEQFGYYLKITEGQFIEVFLNKTVPEYAQKINHFCLEVADIDELELALSNAGVEVWGKQLANDHTWQLWAKDPDGLAIEFQAYTDASTQLTGEDCVIT